MKIRPILFSGPMVRAILDGRKTQTRRLVKGPALDALTVDASFAGDPWAPDLCPYGRDGDALRVREAWRTHVLHDDLVPSDLRRDVPIWYAADPADAYPTLTPGRLRASMHLPGWASRLLLHIAEVRIERLQDISPEDAKAEGLKFDTTLGDDGMWGTPGDHRLWTRSPVEAYERLWERINNPRSESRTQNPAVWAANPWVWVVTFKPERLYERPKP